MVTDNSETIQLEIALWTPEAKALLALDCKTVPNPVGVAKEVMLGMEMVCAARAVEKRDSMEEIMMEACLSLTGNVELEVAKEGVAVGVMEEDEEVVEGAMEEEEVEDASVDEVDASEDVLEEEDEAEELEEDSIDELEDEDEASELDDDEGSAELDGETAAELVVGTKEELLEMADELEETAEDEADELSMLEEELRAD